MTNQPNLQGDMNALDRGFSNAFSIRHGRLGRLQHRCAPAWLGEPSELDVRPCVAPLPGGRGRCHSPAARDFCRKLSADVAEHEIENQILFVTAECLVAYWRSHNLFYPAMEKAFREAAALRFASGGTCSNTRRGAVVLVSKAG